MGSFFPLGLGARRREGIIQDPFTPGDDWDGTAGSGFATVPVDPARTTAKPALRLITPPNQHFTDTLDVGVIAMANNGGTLGDTLGIKEVTFYYEGRVRTVSAPRWNVIETERGVRRYFGWWVRLKRPIGMSGKARLYVEAEALDATMQKRVMGPYNFSPVAQEYDLELTIAPSQSVITGQRYQNLRDAIIYARSQFPHNPRFLITEAGKYEIGRPEAGTDQYEITGRYTIEATVPVSIGRLEYTNDADALIPAHRTWWRWRGTNITYDIRHVRNFAAASRPTDPVQHWMDGINITTSDPNGKRELFRGGTAPRGANLVAGLAYFTECVGSELNTPVNSSSLVRGCTFLDLSQDIMSDSLCVINTVFGRMDQNFWNGNAPAFTVTVPTGDTLERFGGNYSSGTNGGLWQATVGGVVHTFDVGNGSEAYFLGTVTYRGVSGIGGYWTSDVVEWLNTLPGWSATLSEDFATKDRVGAALSRPGLKGQGFTAARGTALVGNGEPQQIVWNVDTHGDWYQHTRGILENAVIAFNTGFDMQCQALFLSPILGQGSTPAGTRDFFFVGNAFSNSPIIRDSFNPNNASTQLSRPQTMSHTCIVHNTFSNQNMIWNFTTGNVIDGGLNLLKNNAVLGARWLGGVVASGVEIDGLHMNAGAIIPDSVTNYITAGTPDTLYASYLTGDFTPTALMRDVGFVPAIPYDASGAAFPTPCAPGAVAALADELLDQETPPPPVEILGPAGLELVEVLSPFIHGGFWVSEGATNPGLLRVPNFAGDADVLQGAAGNQPTIDGLDLVFDSNDAVGSALFAGQYTFYLLFKKDAASTAGQVLVNQVIYALGSLSAAAVSAAARVFVNGVRVFTRDDTFDALDAETGGDTQFAEIRIEALNTGRLDIGRAAGDALVGRLRAVIAIPEFTPSTIEEGVTLANITTLKAKARAAMVELAPALPAYPADPPLITALAIGGTVEDGATLTAVFEVEGDTPLTNTFEWEFNGSAIAGETGATITLDEAGMGLFEGGTLAVNMRSENAGGVDEARAEVTYVSSAGPPITGFIGATTFSTAEASEEFDTTTVVLEPHPDTQVGDTIVALIQGATAAVFSTPSGWSLIGSTNGIGGYLFAREHNGSASYTFQASTVVSAAATLSSYRGYTIGANGGWSATSQISPVAPAIASGVAADSLRLVFAAAGNANTTYNTPTDYTVRASKNVSRSAWAFEANAPVAGPSLGTVTVTRSAGTGSGRAIQLTLTPA